MPRLAGPQEVIIETAGVRLGGALSIPEEPSGVILFAHGSGSSRFSPRNRAVAESLNRRGLATLLFDLLTEREEQLDAMSRELRFDIDLLARRLVMATDWLLEQHEAHASRGIGYFGSSTGAAAALIGAAERPELVSAVVSRGGRPDLADEALHEVRAPTLLIVGGDDQQVLDLNRQAAERMRSPVRMEVIAGATHLFEEPGTLDRVSELAGDWFSRAFDHQARSVLDRRSGDQPEIFADRRDAGRQLARQLADMLDAEQLENTVVVALPRGGVPVAHEVSGRLDVPLDVLFVRKLGAPLQPEYAIGAICEDGSAVVDAEAARATGADDEALRFIMDRELARIADYRQRFAAERHPLDVHDRDVLVIDDGLATGMTALAAARDLRTRGARTITFAAPVCAPQSLRSIGEQFDRAMCVKQPHDFGAVGFWYRDFRPTSDEEIADILSSQADARRPDRRRT